VPINVTIERPGGGCGFTWECSSGEAHTLWDECATLANQQGIDALIFAAATIRSVYEGVEQRRQSRSAGSKFGSFTQCCTR
jgi:hypothetical protein